MKPISVINTAFLFLLLGAAVPASAQYERQQDGWRGENRQTPEEEQIDQANPEWQRGKHQRDHQHQEDQNSQQQRAQQQWQVREQQQQQQQQQQHQHQQQQDRSSGWDKGKKVGWGNGNVPPGQQKRLSEDRRQELIREQQQRDALYRRHLDSQQRLGEQHAAQLQRQQRMAEYRFQQQYQERLRQQQAAVQRARNYDNDPYYYSAPTYRYNRDGRYYKTNEYGAKALRQAVNYGYDQGFRAGRAARQDRWKSAYKNSYAYQDANYGYDGYYVDQADYNHYFREGFRRGYEDGYNNSHRYGRESGGSNSMLSGILSQILNLQQMDN